METVRKPFQGVANIVRFNWHFYAAALSVVLLLILISNLIDESLQQLLYMLSMLILAPVLVSLLTSVYVYDLSGLYKLNWIDDGKPDNLIVNINAGFDETSILLKDKFRDSELVVMDFYDPGKHTEVSIKRARKAYPPYSGTKQVKTDYIPLSTCSVDKVFVIFSAHEIRNQEERTVFFKELSRVLKPNGQIYITEHLRNVSNFLAYNIGFLHFYPKLSWLSTFREANLEVNKEVKLTPFVSTFILEKDGTTP